MRAYSIDIRERVIENLDQESMRKTAKRFRVSEYFVYRLKQRYKEGHTGSQAAWRRARPDCG
jgi:transposase